MTPENCSVKLSVDDLMTSSQNNTGDIEVDLVMATSKIQEFYG